MLLIRKMKEDIRRLGVGMGDKLLVHASLRSLGKTEKGAEGIIEALLECLGEEGTLLLPALSYRTVGPEQPVFDALHTPSCVGALPEYFRCRQGTIRSLHPTHSVCAAGKLAEWFVSSHEKDSTPCGPHSPFFKLPGVGGKVLFIGCGLRPNTSMHAIEELVEPPYLFGKTSDYEIRDPAGRTINMRVRNHGFQGWEQRYDRIAEVLEEPFLKSGMIGNAHCHLVDSREMWKEVKKKLTEAPLFFVDRID